MLKFVALFSIFLCYSGVVESMQCYHCNSHNNSQCADLIPPDSMKIDCSNLQHGSKYTMCRKITQVIEFSVNGLPPDTRVIRGCGYDESNYKGKCYQRSGFGGRQEVCSCLTDYCNDATTLSSFKLYYALLCIVPSLVIFLTSF